MSSTFSAIATRLHDAVLAPQRSIAEKSLLCDRLVRVTPCLSVASGFSQAELSRESPELRRLQLWINIVAEVEYTENAERFLHSLNGARWDNRHASRLLHANGLGLRSKPLGREIEAAVSLSGPAEISYFARSHSAQICQASESIERCALGYLTQNARAEDSFSCAMLFDVYRHYPSPLLLNEARLSEASLDEILSASAALRGRQRVLRRDSRRVVESGCLQFLAAADRAMLCWQWNREAFEDQWECCLAYDSAILHEFVNLRVLTPAEASDVQEIQRAMSLSDEASPISFSALSLMEGFQRRPLWSWLHYVHS